MGASLPGAQVLVLAGCAEPDPVAMDASSAPLPPPDPLLEACIATCDRCSPTMEGTGYGSCAGRCPRAEYTECIARAECEGVSRCYQGPFPTDGGGPFFWSGHTLVLPPPDVPADIAAARLWPPRDAGGGRLPDGGRWGG